MVEHLHQGGDVRVEHGPVDVAEGLPEAVAPEVPLQVHLPAPGLDQGVEIRHAKRLPALPGLEEEFPSPCIRHGQKQRLQGFKDVFVDGHVPQLPRLLLADREVVAGLQVAHLVHGDRQQVAGPKVGVDPQGENGEVPGPVRQELLDEADILRLADRLDLGGGPLLWPVVRAHGYPSLNINFSG